jgi:hypothetical protein
VALLLISGWVVVRRYAALRRDSDPAAASAWRDLTRAWRIRR